MKKLILTLCLCIHMVVFAAEAPHQYVRIQTSFGSCIVKLYNETPLHRDNFVKLVKDGTIEGSLFHRVIKNFMIQGGDPSSINAKPDSLLGNGGLNYRVKAEFNPEIFHKKGVIAAARDNNPEKESSSTQFYLVQGKVFTDAELDSLQKKRLNFEIPEAQRLVYKTLGGTPHLDRNYTAFGEIVLGLDMVDRIALQETDKNNRPRTDVKMHLSLLSKREVRKLEKALKTLAQIQQNN